MTWNICGVRNWTFEDEKGVLGGQTKELRGEDDNPKTTFIFDWACIKLTFSRSFWSKWEHILKDHKYESHIMADIILYPQAWYQKWQSRWPIHSYQLDNRLNEWVRSFKKSELIRLYFGVSVLIFPFFYHGLFEFFKFFCLFCFILFLWHYAACRILVPWPGMEPVPSAVQERSLNHQTAREVQVFILGYLHIIWLNLTSLSKLKHEWQHPYQKAFVE